MTLKYRFKDAIEISFNYSLGKTSEKWKNPPATCLVFLPRACYAVRRTQKGVSVTYYCPFDAVRHQMDSSVSEV